MHPVTKDGYEKVEFEEDSGELVIINKNEAKQIIGLDFDSLPSELESTSNIITAWIRVFAPVYEENAQKWRFWYGDKHEYIDISQTNIAKDAIQRGGSLANDLYRVKMEVTQKQKTSGEFSIHYKIVEVLDFKPAKINPQIEIELNNKSEFFIKYKNCILVPLCDIHDFNKLKTVETSTLS